MATRIAHISGWERARDSRVFFASWFVEVTTDAGQHLQSIDFYELHRARAFAIDLSWRTMVSSVDVIEAHTGQVVFGLGCYALRPFETVDRIGNVTIERDERGQPIRMFIG